MSLAAQMARSVPCTASGGCEAMIFASRSAASCSSARGTTSDTSPIRCAVGAVMRSWFPTRASRRTSPSGIRGTSFIGSYTAAIP